jgi:hypothetical protein
MSEKVLTKEEAIDLINSIQSNCLKPAGIAWDSFKKYQHDEYFWQDAVGVMSSTDIVENYLKHKEETK